MRCITKHVASWSTAGLRIMFCSRPLSNTDGMAQERKSCFCQLAYGKSGSLKSCFASSGRIYRHLGEDLGYEVRADAVGGENVFLGEMTGGWNH